MALQAEQVEQHVCSYCESLPTTTPWSRSGKVSHCPLCHGEILMTTGGATYRIYAEPEQVVLHDQRHPWRWAVVGAVIALVIAGAIWLIVQSRADDSGLSWLSQPPGSPSPPADTVLAKPGATSLLATGKPAPQAPTTVSKPQRVPEPIIESIPERSAAKASAPSEELELVQAKPWRTVPRPTIVRRAFAPPSKDLAAAHLKSELTRTPEAILDAIPGDMDKKEVAKHLDDLAKTIQKHNDKKEDGYIHHLKESRADLAGLPYLLGKDCQLAKTEAETTVVVAAEIREAYSGVRHPYWRSPGEDDDCVAEKFWSFWREGGGKKSRRSDLKHRDPQRAWSTLSQILGPEGSGYHRGLVQEMAKVKGPGAGKQLAKLAIFDVDADVRRDAIAALQGRPEKDYTDVLLDGLRHPWPPAVAHALHAVTTLNRIDLGPQLIDCLGQPDPQAPYEQAGAKHGLEVREMVRVNHAKNCLLCHAPSVNAKTESLPGLVPNPRDPLPESTSTFYYEGADAVIVRADIVYLRQDFSLRMPVENHGVWPEMQRFDFIVRARDLTEEEADKCREGKARGGCCENSAYHQAICDTLVELTGLQLPADATVWRRLQGSLIPPARRWADPCGK